MDALLAEYLPILIFLGIAVGLSVVIVAASYIVARQRPDSEKVSAYECGFEAFDDARSRFDVRFYLVAILFIIFDIEVAFLYPWAINYRSVAGHGSLMALWEIVAFLSLLVLAYLYLWRKGIFDWGRRQRTALDKGRGE